MLFALIGALVIGVSLGLLGSGGSILTVPVLVLMLHRPEKLAITESLAIVGMIALMGSVIYGIRKEIHWKSVLFFGVPGMLGAYIGACGSGYLTGKHQLILFACVMFIVSALMLFGPASFEKKGYAEYPVWITSVQGILVGCLTGLIGCGGGFVIVPALVFLSGLPMTLAVGTSLVIIALNAFTGFAKQLINLNAMDMHVSWETIAIFSLAGILGSIAAGYVSKKIPQIRLRQAFGVSIFLMGTYMLLHQL